jgi:transposase
MQRYTLKDFEKQFPNDDVCLEWLKNYLYPNGIFCETCQKVTMHHKVASRKSYSCDYCGHHVHPTADTIYHKSSTPLRLWFYAIYLMASTRCGISAKQLERELGVTYKTAWRMFHQIRSMLSDGNTKLSGIVEADETWIGGDAKYMHQAKRDKLEMRPGSPKHKTPVFGMVERDGKVRAQPVERLKGSNLIPLLRENIEKGSTLYTDDARPFDLLYGSFSHETINHSAREYVRGDVHTNSMEGFWSLLKGGIKGVYKHVGKDYLQNYINEYAFRYNRRRDVTPMFVSFLNQVRKH